MIIPEHLRHLQTDRHGRPAPYINVIGLDPTTADVPERWTVRHDRIVHQRAAFYTDLPDGEPNLARQSIQRAREVTMLSMCQVCARVVADGERALALSPGRVNMADVPGRGRCAMLGEPWLCHECAEFAVTICPELIRRTRAEELLVVKLPAGTPFWLTMSTGWIEGPYEAATRTDPVALWAMILLPPEVVKIPAPPPPRFEGGRSRGMSLLERERLNKVINDAPEPRLMPRRLETVGAIPDDARAMLEEQQREQDPMEREILMAERRAEMKRRMAVERDRRRARR